MKIKWYHILILALAIFLGWHLGRKNPKIVVETIYDTRIDTITVDSIIYDTDTLILPQGEIDTSAVVGAFYKKKAFDTTIVSNEVKIKFTGSLYENTLRDVVFETQNLRPTQVVTQMKWSVWGGANLGTNLVAPSISIQNNKHQFNIGYNIVGEHKFIFGYKYRLWQN